jgi:hypothetical protein
LSEPKNSGSAIPTSNRPRWRVFGQNKLPTSSRVYLERCKRRQMMAYMRLLQTAVIAACHKRARVL